MIKKTVMSLAILAISGCATLQLAPERLAADESSIRGAEELGAEGVPAARLHLQEAKDQTAFAKRLAADGDDRAVVVLARAESDAELALGLAREVSVHTEAMRAAEDLKAIQGCCTP